MFGRFIRIGVGLVLFGVGTRILLLEKLSLTVLVAVLCLVSLCCGILLGKAVGVKV